MAKQKEVVERFLSGAFIVVAEYRGFKPEIMSWRDKKTGARTSAPIAVHAVEVGDIQLKVTQWLPDDTPKDAEGRPIVFAKHRKGERVVIKLESLEVQSGMYQARGEIHAVEADK